MFLLLNLYFREIDGVIYSGDVKEKEQAKKQYQRAKKRGQSAGLISKKYAIFFFQFCKSGLHYQHTICFQSE